MVGGVVVETVDVPNPGIDDDPDSERFGLELGPRVWINCRDTTYGNECAVFVERTDASRSVSPGDSIWWQGQRAYWTPASRAFTDYALRRIGCSGVSRPLTEV